MKSNPVFQLSFAAFFAALHFYLVAYITSSVIAERLGDQFVAPLFAGGSVLALIVFFSAPRLLRRIGARGFLTLMALIEGAAILGLAGFSGEIATILSVLAHLGFSSLVGFALDLFLEQATDAESVTGNTRGIFFTATNTALVLSPPLMGLIRTSFSFEMVYLASIAFFVVFLIAMIPLYRSFKDSSYNNVSLAGMRFAFMCADIAPTALAHLSLRLFYALAAIYIPLHLSSLGFSWPQIGLMLGIALLPFALTTLPAGKLADSRFGEKEIMITGFVIMAGATALLSLSLPHSFVLYAGILFVTRMGASLVDITTETHFFRAVSSRDINSITLFRMLQPVGYIIGVTLAAGILLVLPLQSAFLAFAFLILLIGIPAALRITDFR